LWTVGSVWRNVRPNDHVWGTGSFGRATDFGGCRKARAGQNVTNITVYSTRGPHTLNSLKQYCSAGFTPFMLEGSDETSSIKTHGDAGFLVPFLFPEYQYNPSNTSLDYCLVMHHYDKEKDLSRYPKENQFPIIQPWETMAGNMTRCKLIVSSSLHGVILGDAFGIPTRWLSNNGAIWPYKFHDYFLSFPKGHWNESWRYLDHAINSPKRTLPMPLEDRLEYARGVLESFPFHLFTTKEVSPEVVDSKEDVP